MNGLGERLRAVREERELSAADVAATTRIPLAYLEALEAGDFEAFTSDLHARGFLRNYASFLGLDVEEVLDQYDERLGRSRDQKDQAPVPPKEKGTWRSTLGQDLLLGLVLVALLALGGFSIYVRQNPAEPVPTEGPPATPTATPAPVHNGTSYEMNVFLDYAKHRLDVQQRIDYTNPTSQTLPDLMLNVHPNFDRRNFVLKDIKVDVEGELQKPEYYPLDVTLRVALPQPLPPGEFITLFLEYTLELPKIRSQAEFVAGSFGYSDRCVSLGHWYPILAPYREEEDKGWYAQTYFPVGDPYVTEVADYKVTITATQGVMIAGTGSETRQGNRWHFEVEKARSFAFAASDRYQVSTAEVGGTTVSSYYFPTHQAAGEAALQTAVQALELFSELYGAYPYADYRAVETEFGGGMEFTGLTFLGSLFYEEYDGTGRTPLVPLTAHEVSHQWFYGLVGNDQVTQPWLDEALAEYNAFVYYERYLPDDSDWWWFYAVDQWAPTGAVDSILYEFRNDSRPYYDAVYRRGALFMRDLRETMGDPAFFGFLGEYQRRYTYQLVSSREFFALVQEFTTADLIPLQEEYFRQRQLQ
ncbi:MAG: helix-turn-helix domain-containing protein [Anaerolineae bacterium]|nr:helix-turn-helix domain-containing protein [Anaerolineae bacterium]